MFFEKQVLFCSFGHLVSTEKGVCVWGGVFKDSPDNECETSAIEHEYTTSRGDQTHKSTTGMGCWGFYSLQPGEQDAIVCIVNSHMLQVLFASSWVLMILT